MSTPSILEPISLTDPELKLLQTLVYQECGMFFDERRIHFLARPRATASESLPGGFLL